jgi:serine/threonine protein kinase
LVLFLWKLFQLVSLLLTLISFVVADFLPATPNLSNIVSFIMATSSIYALYTSLLVRQLWRMPRIRDHYRQLPTRPERPVDTIGFLAYGSFSFRRQDLIGAGGMARVYKVPCTPLHDTRVIRGVHALSPVQGMYAGTMVAVKEVAAGALTPSVCAEAALLSGLRHPAVLHMYGCCAHDAHLYIITELCDTSLHHELLKRSPHRLALEPALSLALQVAEGMQYLHSNGVACALLCSNSLFVVAT